MADKLLPGEEELQIKKLLRSMIGESREKELEEDPRFFELMQDLLVSQELSGGYGPGTVGGGITKLTPAMRAEKIKKLITTPERQALYERSKDLIEQVMTTEPAPERAYLIGSFAGSKQNPHDIDILAQYPAAARGKIPKMETNQPVHRVAYPKPDYLDLEFVRDFFKRMVAKSKQEYGPEYSWTRLLSAIPAARPLMGSKIEESE